MYPKFMKVKDLIDILKKLPENCNVYKDLDDNLESPWLHSVEKVNIVVLKKYIDCNLKRVAYKPCKETESCEEGVVLYVQKIN